jgi:hypothetical protein
VEPVGRGEPCDDAQVRNIGSVDEKRARDGMVEIRRCLVTLRCADELARFQSQARIDVSAGRVDRQSDSFCERVQPLPNCRPLSVREGFRRAFRRRFGMKLERQPARRNAELSGCLLDPDRAEIAVRSNDVRPHE